MLLVDSPELLERAVRALSAQQDALAVDTERASGFRYSQRPYLIQVFTESTGTYLIDTVGVGDLSELGKLLTERPLILHAAGQDIPSLREVGIFPSRLFDTEMAARLAGFKKFGLQSLAEEILEIQLDKAFSAVDWSIRPMPTEWLDYAALDVEILPDLQDRLTEILKEQGRYEIALQEFKTVASKPTKKPPAEPWRKLSGMHTLTTPRQLAVARELWNARDMLARNSDTAPGRLIPDRSIVFASALLPKSKSKLVRAKEFQGKASRSEMNRWYEAIERGMNTTDLPPMRAKKEGTALSTKVKLEIAEKVQTLKDAAQNVADDADLQLELLITKDSLSKLVASETLKDSTTVEDLATQLSDLGLRDWQIELLAQPLLEAFKTNTTKAQNDNP